MGSKVDLLNTDSLAALAKDNGAKVGRWGQLELLPVGSGGENWFNVKAPDDVWALRHLSDALVGWLVTPTALIKFDSSTSFNDHEVVLIAKLLGVDASSSTLLGNGFLVDIGATCEASGGRALLSWLVFGCLMMQAHCQILGVSSGEPRMLSLQDGFAYYISNSAPALSEARKAMVTSGANA